MVERRLGSHKVRIADGIGYSTSLCSVLCFVLFFCVSGKVCANVQEKNAARAEQCCNVVREVKAVYWYKLNCKNCHVFFIVQGWPARVVCTTLFCSVSVLYTVASFIQPKIE